MLHILINFVFLIGEIYCNATFDGYLCWPPTAVSHVTEQHCPQGRMSDPSQFAHRQCGMNGRWLGKYGDEDSPHGWTNYTPCFPAVVRSLLYKVDDEDPGQMKFMIAEIIRGMEIVGFSLSFILLTISICIMHSYPTLHSIRTKIHKNLFLAMNAQVVVRLIVYIDQALMRLGIGQNETTGMSAMEQVPPLCIGMYIILEFLNTSMFIWMLNEGIYLNTLVTSNVLRGNDWYRYYWVGGWIFPLILTGIWATVSYFNYADDVYLTCWYGYNFQPYYWILQGPRLTVIVVNFCFLGNIIRVLVVKLRQDNSSEVVMVRKAVKATAVLLPLLGITNILSMFEGPVSGPVWGFASHSSVTHFLRCFQGAFLSILYCFLNAEINALLARSISNRVIIFRHRYPRASRCFGLRARRRRQPHRPGTPAICGRPTPRPDDIQMRIQPLWTPRSQMLESAPITARVSETEFGGTRPDCSRPRSAPAAAHCHETVITIEPRRGMAALQYLPTQDN